MHSADAPSGQAKAIVLRIIAEQLRLGWDDIVKQELTPRIWRLVQQLAFRSEPLTVRNGHLLGALTEHSTSPGKG